MEIINFTNAFYIKLGRKGEWEESSIRESKIRIGWINQTLEDINQGNWDIILEQIKQENIHKIKGVSTLDFNALKTIVESSEEDIWITFYLSKLWWCQPGESIIYEDNISKYRKIKDRWKDSDINENPLIINQIPGRLSQIQGFRATVCKVKAIDDLRRLLNAQPSDEYKAIFDSKATLIKEVESGLKLLHWKGFETLVDLIFSNSGWRRITFIGKAMKYVDMEFVEPITGDLYQVQVKSQATLLDFREYAEQFSSTNFRKFYFVVHSPTEDLINHQSNSQDNAELILSNRLSEMVVESGLTDWLMQKIR